jgi:hypothetical protein
MDLRRRGVVLEAEGKTLHVDAPAGAVTEELRTALRENKRAIIKLLYWERRKLEKADQLGLVIRHARERGWIALHDPLSGDWHEVREEECLSSIVEAARAERRRHMKRV